MSNIIPLSQQTIGGNTLQTVNARHLHTFLQVKARFSDWIARRIESYEFTQDIDFTCYSDLSSGNPNPPIDYHLSLDMAKELSMVEKTAKGKEARLYFLACERAAKETSHVPQVKDPAIQMLIDMAVHLDEARTLAAQANVKADLALQSQAWLTIRQYVLIHTLEHQLPESLQKAYGIWLRNHCGERNIPVYKANPTDRSYDGENTYHSGTIQQTLLPWLTRRQGQGHLLPVPVRKPVS